eukprot:Lithocolla_globosa_v1_NODE_3470_length_1661_cov_21.199875.p2 type:complete len:111 gc:universal NODE_3470_length_1661_cov_21.199875:825-493(-)
MQAPKTHPSPLRNRGHCHEHHFLLTQEARPRLHSLCPNRIFFCTVSSKMYRLVGHDALQSIFYMHWCDHHREFQSNQLSKMRPLDLHPLPMYHFHIQTMLGPRPRQVGLL